MRELDVFAEYLGRLRQEKLELSHRALVVAGPDWAGSARSYALEAQFCARVLGALKELDRDSAAFIVQYLQRREG